MNAAKVRVRFHSKILGVKDKDARLDHLLPGRWAGSDFFFGG